MKFIKIFPFILVLFLFSSCNMNPDTTQSSTSDISSASGPNIDNYFVKAVHGPMMDEYIVCYKNDDGTETEIVSMGSQQQPLTIINDRIYYCNPNGVFSVNLEGEDKISCYIDRMNLTRICYYDDDYLYCTGHNDIKVLQVSLDLKEHKELRAFPPEFKRIDYPALIEDIEATVGAEAEDISVVSSSITLDFNGSTKGMRIFAMRPSSEGSTQEMNYIIVDNGNGEDMLSTEFNLVKEPPDNISSGRMGLTEYLDVAERIQKSNLIPDNTVGNPSNSLLHYKRNDYQSYFEDPSFPVRYFKLSGESYEEIDAPSNLEEYDYMTVIPTYSSKETNRPDKTMIREDGSSIGNLMVIIF